MQMASNAENSLKAISIMVDITTLISYLTSRLGDVSSMIHNAQSQGRDISEEELSLLDAALANARTRLKDVIAKKG
jgi:hypothetical protein